MKRETEKTQISSLPRQTIFSALFLAAAFVLAAQSLPAQTNALETIRAALQSYQGLRGQALTAASGNTATDPRAAAMAGQLRQLFQPLSTAQSAAATQPTQSPSPGLAQESRQALQLLRQTAGADATVRWRPQNRTAMQIQGRVLEPPATGAALATEGSREERTARNFLRRQRVLLRLEDPDHELQVVVRVRDEISHQHFRFAQVHQGLPVWPSGLSVHLDPAGNVDLLDGAYIPTPAGLSLQPAIAAAAAAQLAQAGIPGGRPGAASAPELIIYGPLDKAPRLGWKLNVAADLLHQWRAVVDAQNGRLLHWEPLWLDAGVAGSGKDLDGKVQTLNVWQQGTTYYLTDTSKPMFQSAFDPVNNPHGVIMIQDANNATPDQITPNAKFQLVTSTDPNNWSLPDAVSAAVNFSITYDYYLQRHNRNAIDGKGGTITAVVRIAKFENACWVDSLKTMFFGNAEPYAKCLDVIGHELTHGVTASTAGLVGHSQPGAMNEAFSDIFGEMVEAYASKTDPDWLMGTGLPEVVRNLQDPEVATGEGKHPAKMSEYQDLPDDGNHDSGGVHINSTIISHAYYLFAAGLTNKVGLSDAERVFYRCQTQHLHPQSQFIDARLGVIASAEELFGKGSAQALAAAAAFDAVELFDAPNAAPPSSLPVVQGSDSTAFIYFDLSVFNYAVGRRETAQGDGNAGSTLAGPSQFARPSVSGDGALAVFVDDQYDLGAVLTGNRLSEQRLGYPGQVHSVAISPDKRYYAFVLRNALTGQADNQINLFDLGSNTVRTFKLLAPAKDSAPLNNVVYADSMVFSSDSHTLVYDAVSQVQFAGIGTVQRWSVFGLDIRTGNIFIIVPPLEKYDTGNPAIGRAGTRYLTFEAVDGATTNSTIINMDLFTGDVALVGAVKGGLGYPYFTGDESAVIYTKEDPSAMIGTSLVKQSLAADRLTPVGQPTVWLQNGLIGVIYRRGTFVQSNALPQVALTGPTNGAAFTPPATITLTADASESGGQIAKVEFYRGSTQLGEATAAPYSLTWTNVGAGSYRLIARAINTLGGTTDSEAATITVAPAGGTLPAILTQPANPTVTAGGSATFTVSASGTAPLTYQWQFQDVNLAGQNAPTLTLTQVQTNQAGPYRVVVSNAYGSVASVEALLTVSPTNAVNPTNATLRIVSWRRSSATEFDLVFSSQPGQPYQLEFSTNLQTWTALATATASTTNTSFQDPNAGQSLSRFYRIKLATAVVGMPSLVTPPASQTVVPGTNVTFTVTANGTDLRYQWSKDGQALAGQTNATLTLTNVAAAQAGAYTVQVSNAAGSVTSNAATLTVAAAQGLATMPQVGVVYPAGTEIGGPLFGIQFAIPPGWKGGVQTGVFALVFTSNIYTNIGVVGIVGFAGDQNFFLQDPTLQTGYQTPIGTFDKAFMAPVKPISAVASNRLTAEFQGAGSVATYYAVVDVTVHPSGGGMIFYGLCTVDQKDTMKAQVKLFGDTVQTTPRPTDTAMMLQLNGHSFQWSGGGNDWYSNQQGYYSRDAAVSDWSDNYVSFCAQGTFDVNKTTTTYASTTSASGEFSQISGDATSTEYGQWTIVKDPQYGDLIFMVTLSGYQILPIKFDVDGSLLVGPNRLAPYGTFNCH